MSEKAWTPHAPDAIPAPTQGSIRDIHSLANINELCPERLHLDWTVDWDRKRIHGNVTHTLRVLKQGTTHATFDTSYLAIGTVLVDGEPTTSTLAPSRTVLGQPLTVPIGSRDVDAKVTVQIAYSTTDECTALGWLAKEQTKAKKQPFLYSQCQAIHARSLVPCMDAPGRKITYTASVTSPIPVLMSALHDGEPTSADNGAKVYRFKQPVSIPTYLIAIVGGELAFRALGPRTGVWAEPPDADAVQWEFEADAERFLEQAEKLVSPYAWTRYDSVVLPPSFPYGGMENANLTTLTPSLVCGDRSATDVLLHELCHSWSGNLTSCVNWESFWLNEGWTVYLERLLLQKVHGDKEGPAYRGFSYLMGARGLKDALHGFAKTPRFQRLIPAYTDGEDPDDAFSTIPYDKGSNFLLHLERTVGGLEVFTPYVRAYFHAFRDRAVSTEQWKEHLFAFFAGNEHITAKLEQVDWNAWLHGEGEDLPVNMEYDDTLARDAYHLAARWEAAWENATKRSDAPATFAQDDIAQWDVNQKVVFLETLHTATPKPAWVLEWLDKTYELSQAANPEVCLRFLELALATPQSGYERRAAEWVCERLTSGIHPGPYEILPCHLQGTVSGRRQTGARDVHEAQVVLYVASTHPDHPIAAAQISKVSTEHARHRGAGHSSRDKYQPQRDRTLSCSLLGNNILTIRTWRAHPPRRSLRSWGVPGPASRSWGSMWRWTNKRKAAALRSCRQTACKPTAVST